jgi:hypothetical protein
VSRPEASSPHAFDCLYEALLMVSIEIIQHHV